jgi:hypothetical protein
MIKVKNTSKSGTIFFINNEYGRLKDGRFVPYSKEELSIKTAYKDSYGWKDYHSIDDYIEARRIYNEKRKKENAEIELKYAEIRKKENEKLESLMPLGPIPATVENVRLLLNFLNEKNWGSWTLPKMTIGYSAHQYDCEGCTATTITLDANISDDFVSGNKFKVGGRNGHLTQYISL